MTNKKLFSFLQTAYEILCFAGCLAIIPFIKEEVSRTIPFLFIPFLLLYLTKATIVRKFAFGVVLTLLAYCTWTVLITFYFTGYLDKKAMLAEHSLWDVFAFLIPFVLAALTLVWSLTKRTGKHKFEIVYLICLMVTFFILANIR